MKKKNKKYAAKSITLMANNHTYHLYDIEKFSITFMGNLKIIGYVNKTKIEETFGLDECKKMIVEF